MKKSDTILRVAFSIMRFCIKHEGEQILEISDTLAEIVGAEYAGQKKQLVQ